MPTTTRKSEAGDVGQIFEAFEPDFAHSKRLLHVGFLVTSAASINAPIVFVPIRETIELDPKKHRAWLKRTYNAGLRLARLLAREPRYIEDGWKVRDCRTHTPPCCFLPLAKLGGGAKNATLRCKASGRVFPPDEQLWEVTFRAGMDLVSNALREQLFKIPMSIRQRSKYNFGELDRVDRFRRQIARQARRLESQRLRTAAAYSKILHRTDDRCPVHGGKSLAQRLSRCD